MAGSYDEIQLGERGRFATVLTAKTGLCGESVGPPADGAGGFVSRRMHSVCTTCTATFTSG